jgi:hypothetical protein
VPRDEAERIAARYSLLILDTPPELRFDKIVAFAAREFDVPIALITLVDQDRQWFKSSVGMGEVCENRARHLLLQHCAWWLMHSLRLRPAQRQGFRTPHNFTRREAP